MIHVSYTPNVFDPTTTQRWSERWTIGVSIETLLPERIKRVNRVNRALIARRNGIRIEPTEWWRQLVDGDCIDFYEEPAGFESATLALPFIGEVFTVTSPLAVAATLTAAAAVSAIAAKAAVRALTPSVHKPKKGERAQGTYGFQGITANRRDEGAALPVVYGETRVAGPIVGLWTRSTANATELYLIAVVAGHEVERIGDKTADGEFSVEEFNLPTGMRLGNQPIENYDDVDVFVRMGTATQSPIPDFDTPILQAEVNQVLQPPDDASTAEITPGVYAASDSALDVWTTQVAFTTGEPADEFIAEIAFLGGLFRLNTTGDTTSTSVTLQGRYRRVDSDGVPFGDYVVLPKWPAITAARPESFAVEVGSTFIDPADFAVPTAGEFMQFDGVNDYLVNIAPTGIPSMTASATEIGVSAWVRLDLTVASGTGTYADPFIVSAPSTTKQYLVTQFASNKGFEFYLEVVASTTYLYREENGNWCRIPAFRLGARLGDGTTVETFQANHKNHPARRFSRALMPAAITATGAVTGRFALVGMSYKAGDPDENGDNSLRFFTYCATYQGQPHTTRTTTTDHLWNETAAIYVGSQDGTTGFLGGDIDDVLLYQRALTSIDMASKWNGGNGVAGTASEVSIVAGWHMDTATTTTADFVGSNALTLTGGPTVSSSGGPVAGSASGTLLRDRYLIEIQRITDPATKHGRDEPTLANVKTFTYDRINYAGAAVVATRVRWNDQIQGLDPNISVPVRGAKVGVWDGIDEIHPNLPATWTTNPAWQIVDAALNEEYGLGRDIDVDRIDLPAFREAASYFDEPVGDGIDARPAIQFFQSAPGTDPNYPNGYYHFDVLDADWPRQYPPAQDNGGTPFTADEAPEFFGPTNVDAGAPAWVSAIEDVPLPVGEILHISAAPKRWEVRCHAPAGYAPTATGTYTPASRTTDLVKHYDKRWQFNGVFDDENADAWTAMQTIAHAANSSLSFSGDKLTIHVDRARAVSAMVTDANVLPGSLKMSWLSKRDRPNAIEAEYLDEREGYEKRPLDLEHSDLTDPTNTDPRITRRVQLRGVTRRSQGERLLRYQLNVFARALRTIEFDVGPDALGYMPGDVIAFSHGLPAWGVSGRLIADSPNADPSELFLDQPVTIASGTSYEIAVRDSKTGSIETVAVDETTTGGAGTYAPGSRITMEAAFLNRPKRGDLYAWGEVSKTRKLFRVVSTSFDATTFKRHVVAAEYDDSFYDAEAFAAALTSPSALPSPPIGSI